MNILFVGAHPDDIETAAGGTALRYKERGDNIFFCIATNGNVGSSTMPKKDIEKIRHAEALAAADFAGAELIWLGFDDEFLMDSVETRHAFINAFRTAKPDAVFCHFRNDYNPDHSVSGYIVDECISMAGIPNIKTDMPPTTGKIPPVYFMDTPAGVNFSPEIYVDIGRVFDKKVQLLSHHKSQDQWMKDLFGYEMGAFLEIPAKFRGLQASVKMAEAFIPSQRWGRTFTRHFLPDCLNS